MTNQAFEVIEKVKNEVATYHQILYKPINGLLSFIEFGPIFILIWRTDVDSRISVGSPCIKQDQVII